MRSTTTAARAGKTATNRVSSAMSASEIIAILVEHRCPDITDQLDLDKCGRLPISGGGSGDIYHGLLGGGEQVAIKCARWRLRLDDTQGDKTLKRVARELYTWSRLKHENVLALLGLAQFQDQTAMVSPWMENGTLLEYIRRNPDTERHRLCVGISEGVAYLHQNNVIHGDIKSGNVLVSDEGVAKLADFGCSGLKTATLGFTTTTSAPSFSTRWAAPEILEGSVPQSKMADMYALGMTLLEIVTGEFPFPDKQDMAVSHIVAIKKLIPKRPGEFPSFNTNEANDLWEIMAKLWAHEPSDRPTATAVQGLLKGMKLPRTYPPNIIDTLSGKCKYFVAPVKVQSGKMEYPIFSISIDRHLVPRLVDNDTGCHLDSELIVKLDSSDPTSGFLIGLRIYYWNTEKHKFESRVKVPGDANHPAQRISVPLYDSLEGAVSRATVLKQTCTPNELEPAIGCEPVQPPKLGIHAQQDDIDKWVDNAFATCPTQGRMIECPKPGCETRCGRARALKDHVYRHYDILPYKCLFEGCAKSFRTYTHMMKHYDNIHKCGGCNKLFSRDDSKRHKKTCLGLLSGKSRGPRRPLTS
ncbi:hypothetical protein FRC08_007374 [Ceratobasidium sp. 394]|nr:hypothetical protein FRC08_007374 [Ceratobasidium sp. 394]